MVDYYSRTIEVEQHLQYIINRINNSTAIANIIIKPNNNNNNNNNNLLRNILGHQVLERVAPALYPILFFCRC